MELGKLNSHMQKNHTRQLLYTAHKNLLKWIKDLIVRLENKKFLEENMDSKLFVTSLSTIFLDMSPQARETKAKTHKYKVKETTVKTKRQISKWKTIFLTELTSLYIKSFYKVITNLTLQWKRSKELHTDRPHTYRQTWNKNN